MSGLDRGRLSSAHAIAFLALVVALSGSAYAVTKAPKDSVTSTSVKDKSLKGKDVKDDNLTGADVDEGTLGQVPRASTAGTADSAALAALADKLDGLDSSQLVQGEGRLLEARLAGLTGPNTGQQILDIPGWGAIQVSDCTPDATAASRHAAARFNPPDSSTNTFFTHAASFPNNAAPSSLRAAANNITTPIFGTPGFGNAGANEVVEVMIVRLSDGAVANVWIFEQTDGTTCTFTVRALAS